MHDPQVRRIAWAILLVASSLLAFELVLTRLFSVIIWNHFAFLAISVGLFGFGVAGVTVFLRPDVFRPERAAVQLRRSLLALPVVMWAVVAIVCTLPVRIDFSSQMFVLLALIFGLTTLPFFVGGIAVTLALTHWHGHVNRIYGFDLVGSALGCVAVIALLDRLDGPTAALALGLLPAGAALLLQRTRGAAALLAVLLVGVIVNDAQGWIRVRMARSRVETPLFERWNAFSRVTVSDAPFMGWGLARPDAADGVESLAIRIDADALTPMVRFDGDFEQVGVVLEDVTALAYHLKTDARNALVIGPGGGKDVLAALASGVERVRAVELNPIIARDIVGGAFREFTGDLYRRPEVDLVVAEGRSFVRRDAHRYDIVQVSMVDTSAASAAGAYALTENSLYTVEAAREFMARLAPGGILTATWVNLENLEGVNRLVAVYQEALRGRGVTSARDHIAVVAATPPVGWVRFANVLVKPAGFGAEEVARLRAVSRRLGFVPLHLPGVELNRPRDRDHRVIRRILEGRELDRFFDSYRLDLRPVSDDRPFFFYQNRFRDLGAALTSWNPGPLYGNGMFILAKLLIISGVAVVAFMIGPLLAARGSQVRELRAVWPFLLYFFCLGTGFIALEIALLQLFGYYLGHPLLGLGVCLGSILLTTGLGSWAAGRWRDAELQRRLVLVLVAIVALGLVGFDVVPRIVHATLGWPTALRVGVVLALTAPLGLLLGMPFPSGLRLLGASRHLTPWMWAINGGASVFGATSATLMVIHTGFAWSILLGAALYGLALVAAARMRPPRSAPALPVGP